MNPMPQKLGWPLAAAVGMAICLMTAMTARGLWASNAIKGSAHGDPDTGAQLRWIPNQSSDSRDTGLCSNCHMQHASLDSTDTPNSGSGNPKMLPAQSGSSPWINSTCFVCHTDTNANLPGWGGQAKFELSSHWTSGNVVYPASGNNSGECVNCHNPHGVKISEADNLTGGPYTSATQPTSDLTIRQEEYLCYECHDGAPAATNIKDAFTYRTNATPTFYTHPINRVTNLNDRTPWYHGLAGDTVNWSSNPHVECEDCHNPHYAQGGAHTVGDTKAGNVLLGTYGVQVNVWPDSTGLFLGLRPPAPTNWQKVQFTASRTNYEYELCLRCHSSFSAGIPSGAAPNILTDISRDINPDQLAIHPIIKKGKLRSGNIGDTVFTAGWTKNSYVTCSDCHYVHGEPTGGNFYAMKYLLRTFDPAGAGATNEEHVICYKCHDYQVYDNSGANQTRSRVSHPLNAANHYSSSNVKNFVGIWCMNCHGGGINGGIHGTDTGVGGAGGATRMGEHFMTGSSIIGFTYDNGAGKVACWTKGTADVFDVSCAQGHSNKVFSFNFNY